MIMKINKKKLALILVMICSLIFIICFFMFHNRIIPKKQIISSFSKNSEKFKNIEEYMEKDEGDFYIDYDDGELIVDRNGKKLNLDSLPIKDDVLFLVHKLHFTNISEFHGIVRFATYSGPNYLNQGVVYLGRTNAESYGASSEHLRERWYYYMERSIP